MPRQLWQFNNKVQIQKATDASPNSVSEVLPVYTTTYPRWASIQPTSGREFMAAMQVLPTLNSIVVMQWDSKTSQISARDRIVIKDRTLNIAAVFNEGEDNHFIVLWCVEVEA